MKSSALTEISSVEAAHLMARVTLVQSLIYNHALQEWLKIPQTGNFRGNNWQHADMSPQKLDWNSWVAEIHGCVLNWMASHLKWDQWCCERGYIIRQISCNCGGQVISFLLEFFSLSIFISLLVTNTHSCTIWNLEPLPSLPLIHPHTQRRTFCLLQSFKQLQNHWRLSNLWTEQKV